VALSKQIEEKNVRVNTTTVYQSLWQKKNVETDRRLSVEQAMHWLLAISMSNNIVVVDIAHQVAMIQEQHTKHFTSVSPANP